jgi:hypothetical protein
MADENWYGCYGICIDRKFSDGLTLTNPGPCGVIKHDWTTRQASSSDI